MTEFGKQLRTFRQRCNDPKSPQGKLTQETFGELVGAELGIHGYTGAAVSDWERDKSKIHADDRPLLIAIMKVLYEHEGIKTIKEANQLLNAGNYSDLDPKEIAKIFRPERAETEHSPPSVQQETSKSFFRSAVKNVFFFSDEELQTLFSEAEKGPSPAWPRIAAALMRKSSERISFSPKTVFWIGIWWMAWWLMVPSLRWPFANRSAAFQSIGMYVLGTLAVPLLIGMLIDTEHNEYWRANNQAHSKFLRLFTYQGAAIGFNLGYFFIVPLMLLRYYLGLGSSRWLEFATVTLGLILGNMAAHVVPHNLWLAYSRLHLKDGLIFFVVAFMGPLWGLFFLEYYSILLRPLWGGMIILVAFLLFILISIQQSKKGVQNKGNLK